MTISANTGLKTGDTVVYKGQEAVVRDADSYTIEVGGKTFTVDKNDLFGMNNRDNDYDMYSDWIDSYDETIEENKQTIKENKNLWAVAHDTIIGVRKQMRSILSGAGVSTFTELSAEQQSQYLALRNDKYTARSTQIRAVADIQRAAHSTASACSSKMNAINQQAISEILMG